MSRPRLAFLVPTKDRREALTRTLPRILVAARRTSAEVVVCDQSAQAFPETDGLRVLHRPDLSGLPAARNVLLASTTAELVCFLDDDCDPGQDFAVQALALAMAEPGLVAWGPVVETRSASLRRKHRVAHLGALADPRRQTGRRVDRATRALFGCCFVVRRQVALATGFDARRPGYALGEDLEFFLRLPGPKRFARSLRAVHRCETATRQDPRQRGAAKAAWLYWLASRHGRDNPASLLHLAWGLLAAASGQGREPGHWRGVGTALIRDPLRTRW